MNVWKKLVKRKQGNIMVSVLLAGGSDEIKYSYNLKIVCLIKLREDVGDLHDSKVN